MSIEKLSIDGCWIFKPEVHLDDRGKFFEWFQDSTFHKQVKTDFKLAQANCSVSNAGTLRGLHYTQNKPGQSKFVTVFSGKVFDVIVDIRKNSNTFGKWESIVLDSDEPKSIYIPWGVAHGFMALEDESVFAYLCDQRYNPANEFDLNAFDPDIGIAWPDNLDIKMSPKDRAAPSLEFISNNLPIGS